MNSWLPLTEYATKHRVSVSTLRRRIKAEDIKFRFEDGKYFLIDEPMSAHPRTHRPSPESENSTVGTHQGIHPVRSQGLAATGSQVSSENKAQGFSVTESAESLAAKMNKDEPILTAANKLLNELKKAYTLILQEKEEQILQLKDETADLKTLVRVLESENDRMRGLRN